MSKGLLKLLKSRDRVFKLVCGAGNECVEEVERLVTIYSIAGCQIFDISANVDILSAAKRGIERAKSFGTISDRYICVSVGIKGDPHILKSKIDRDRCQQCGQCSYVCPNDAIKNCEVLFNRCLGCGKCYRVCPAQAVEMYSVERDLEAVIPELVAGGIDCVEFHVTTESSCGILEKWEIINKNFDGVLSICIDRMNLGNKQVLERIRLLLEKRKAFTTIIQADGIPMSGSDDRYKTTLQAVAMGEIIQDAKLPVYVILSGGTNSKTVKLADMCGIEYRGVAIGSYARKIVKPYISRDDFWSNEVVFNEALTKAKILVKSVLG